CGAEVFGMETPEIDAELILLAANVRENLELKSYVNLEINSLGSTASRATYRNELVSYLQKYQDQLDEDSLRRLTSNPLRILDSKNPTVQALLQNAPKLTNYFDTESQLHFEQL